MFRLSCTRLGQWAIGYVTENGDILQTIPQNKSLMRVLIDGDTNKFYTRPKGLETNPDLRQYINETDPQAVEINEEEYQIYCDMGSTFQLCKVIISSLETYSSVHSYFPCKNLKKLETSRTPEIYAKRPKFHLFLNSSRVK